MRSFIRQSIKVGRVCSFSQSYKSELCDCILKIISEELNVKGNFYDILQAFLNYKNKHFKIYEKVYENQFNEYRDEDVEEKEKFIIESFSQLPIYQLKKQLKLDEMIWDIDAVCIYPSALWDESSIYLSIETGYAYTQDMNDELVKIVNFGEFKQGSAILKSKYYNLKNLIVQHLPVKERQKKIEINRMGTGYFMDTLICVDLQQIVKNGGRVIQI